MKIKNLNYKISNDKRGSFSKLLSYIQNKKLLKNKIKEVNISISKKKGTLRGLHYQIGKYKEIKVIYCLSGRIFDVAININEKSNDYLKKEINILDSKKNNFLIIPEDFAHGLQTLEQNTKILYLSTNIHSVKFERRINPLDDHLSIKWPIQKKYISKKDKNAPKIKIKKKRFNK